MSDDPGRNQRPQGDPPAQDDPQPATPPSPMESPPEGRGVVVGAGNGASVDPTHEVELWNGRTSWKHFAGSLFLWVLISVVFAVAADWAAAGKEGWTFGRKLLLDVIVVAAVGLFILGRMLLNILSFRYRLTNQRLFIERGILSQTIDQTELIRVDDVRLHKSFMDRVLGLGTLEVISTDSTDNNLRVVGIDGPEKVAESIRTNMRQLRRKSLFVENL